tara:strand:+ start:7552 stop:8883 length:1332 start_codon:yes stop_codon:yes gene_type:complete
MSAVNYQVTPQSTSVVPGQTVAQSMQASGGFYTISSVITPINPSTHTVQASFFTIAGSNGVEDFSTTTGLGNRTYEDISILPEGVLKVTINDTGVNEVVLKVSLLPNFIIPSNATNPFQIILDIDGDAQTITTTTQATGNVGIFTLEVDLTSSTPNAKVFAVIPPSVGSFNMFNTSSWSISSQVDPSDYTTAKAIFIPNSQTTEQSPILGAGSVVDAASPTSQAWFWIVPDPGYTISKYNFSIQNTNSGNQFSVLPSISQNPYSGNTTLSSSSSTSNFNLTYNAASVISDQTNLIGNLQPGSYSYSGWSNSSVTVTSPAVSPSTLSTVSTVNYNDLVQGATVSSYSNFAQILLVDTVSFSDSYPSNFIPTSGQLATLQSSEVPSGYATSDWVNNAILVVLNGFYNYIPGANTPSLKINIAGSAMLADNNQSEEFNFSIQDISD